jgi:hypothetical protein
LILIPVQSIIIPYHIVGSETVIREARTALDVGHDTFISVCSERDIGGYVSECVAGSSRYLCDLLGETFEKT